jgi:ABC-type branched-subunit amino acid transport system substrate-binding protein
LNLRHSQAGCRARSPSLIFGRDKVLKGYMRVLLSVAAALVLEFIFPCPAAAEGLELPIGILIELSGASAEQGQDCRDGIELARALEPPGGVGAARVLPRYEDSQADPKEAVAAFSRLVDIGHSAAVIIIRSPVGLALNPISQSKRIPILGAGVAYAEFVDANPYAFRYWPTTNSEGAALAREMNKRGPLRLAMLSTEDSYTMSLRKQLVSELTNAGVAIVYDEQVLPEERTFAAYAAGIRQSGADAVFVNVKPGQVGLSVRELRRLGGEQRLFGNYFARFSEEIAIAGAAAVEGMVFVELDMMRPRFVAELKRRSPEARVSPITYTCYAAFSGLLSAVGKIAGTPTKDRLYASLSSNQEIALLDETLIVRGREAQYPLRCKLIHSGTVGPCEADTH